MADLARQSEATFLVEWVANHRGPTDPTEEDEEAGGEAKGSVVRKEGKRGDNNY